jgi:predicted O-methyltransferase YrrM
MRQELQARLGHGSDIGGHLEFLCQAVIEQARATTPERFVQVAELGVRAGYSTCAFLAALETVPGMLWSLDIRPAQVPAEWFRLPGWNFRQADDISEQARAFIPAQLDVLFIDTSHELDHTLAELVAYASRVRQGGIICCHDTQWLPGDIDSGTPTGPVAQALDVWCQASPVGLRWENRPGSYGMGVIRP